MKYWTTTEAAKAWGVSRQHVLRHAQAIRRAFVMGKRWFIPAGAKNPGQSHPGRPPRQTPPQRQAQRPPTRRKGKKP